MPRIKVLAGFALFCVLFATSSLLVGCSKGTSTASTKGNSVKGGDGPNETKEGEDDLDRSESGEEDGDKAKSADELVDEELAKRRKEEKKPPVELDDFQVMPYDAAKKADKKTLLSIVPAKPGHWSTSVRALRANDDNYSGGMEMFVSKSGGIQKPVPHTRYWMEYDRPVALAKGELRFPELDFFLPEDPRSTLAATLSSELSLRGASRPVVTSFQHGLQLMQPHEHFFVVLTSNTAAHGYWRLSDVARPPKMSAMFEFTEGSVNDNLESLESQVRNRLEAEESRRSVYYRVVTPTLSAREPTPLPQSVMAWTPIACVLWDDVDASLLNPLQQQALLDWLHWGGQLLISGPQSLEALRGGFLQPYLPATAGKSLTLSTEDFSEMSRRWGLSAAIDLPKPIACVQLKPEKSTADSQTAVMLASPNGEPLVVERRCGRGRVVATAFRLSERGLSSGWKGFDNFVNGALLRRPPREFFKSSGDKTYFPIWQGQPGRMFDGRLISNLCIFGRDAMPHHEHLALESQMDVFGGRIEQELRGSSAAYDPGTASTPKFGRGVWSSESPVSNAARQSLKKASGIEIPKAEFVLWVTAAYLVLLAPINYIFFKLLGRLEWAWIMVPFMSLTAAATVIHLAQLEIGFVSSHTEVAVLELQGGYGRGWVTRYGALYTSLADDFSIQFDDPGAKALPFARDPRFELEQLERPSRVTFQQRAAATAGKNAAEMAGMRIISNDTDFFRAEHMLPLTGPLKLEDLTAGVATISNGTSHRIRKAVLVRHKSRRKNGIELETAWLGDIEPGAVVKANLVSEFRETSAAFQALSEEEAGQQGPLFPQWRVQDDGEAEGKNLLDLSELLQLAVFDCGQELGALRLIGVVESSVTGMQIQPKPAQQRGVTLVVANLTQGSFQPPTADANAPVVGVEDEAAEIEPTE